MNALAQLTDDELDAVMTHAGLLRSALHKIEAENLMPFFREELYRLEQHSNWQLVARGVIAPEGFWDEPEAI